MSTVFQPSLASWESHALHNYPTVPQAARSTATMNDTRGSQYYRYPVQQEQEQQQQQQHQPQPQTTYNHYYPQGPPTHPQHDLHAASQIPQRRNGSISTVPQTVQAVGQTIKPSTPPSSSSTMKKDDSESLVYHSLQIPKCISPSGGNLADFAAQMTCLFWFESIDELKQAESIRTRDPNAPIPRLPSLAKPYDQFRKWVYSVLSTTQVTQNVILLALLFIYRLKMSTPQIKGRAGSEYRLLTVALMLGNKFLDDNTYTNKTWAEVSCFNVQEIHVMEVEFLSNMRYNLVATKEQWEDWLDKLACFHEYYERAVRLPESPVHIPSPTNKTYRSPVASPTGVMQPTVNLPPTPAVTNNYSPTSSHSQNWNAYQSNTVSPLATKPSLQFPVSRKRSPEGEILEHPAKRLAPPQRGPGPAMVHVVQPRSNGIVEPARLPVPHLSVMTGQPQTHSSLTPFNNANVNINVNGYSQNTQQMAQPVHVSLPPLQTGMRAMSTVYTSTPTGMVQKQSLPTATGVTMAQAGFPSQAPVNFGTPTKQHSPGRLGAFNSSPLAEAYGQASAIHTPMTHTPISNSPSVYLQQRHSPYKPVRHVNTLLYPPPSASLEQYHLSVPVPPTQMHYQPLGRRNDLRTGIVPEFVVYDRGHPQHQTLPPHGLIQGHYPS
ncbi:meiotically up-regulated 80 [Fusarium heterosporum]|uniref:Meiotically up-regulated 80 n=1 Tax=Fusarium heterosporum TaxID=42747 RepID=A0A8H5T721_FUSHE|nr:meiotically up-regulated 80 [Fusarium heterosporum]